MILFLVQRNRPLVFLQLPIENIGNCQLRKTGCTIDGAKEMNKWMAVDDTQPPLISLTIACWFFTCLSLCVTWPIALCYW